MRIRQYTGPATAILLVASLGACQGPADSQATATAAIPAEAVKSAGTTEAADPHPALEDLVLSASGLGPLTVGVPMAGNPGAEMVEWDPDYCLTETEGAPFDPAGDPGRWVFSGYDYDTGPTEANVPPFQVGVSDEGSVIGINVGGVAPHTAENIRVGSSFSALQAAYADLQGPVGGEGASLSWWVQGNSGMVLFEFLTDPAVDPSATVDFIGVRAAGIAPGDAWADGDVGARISCS